jgi:hypothetical protein
LLSILSFWGVGSIVSFGSVLSIGGVGSRARARNPRSRSRTSGRAEDVIVAHERRVRLHNSGIFLLSVLRVPQRRR